MEFTPRNAAKYVVRAVIASKVSHTASNIITDYTEFEDDDLVVEIPSFLAGWYVSSKLKPLTDTMVDKAADFVATKRQELKDSRKKDNPDEK